MHCVDLGESFSTHIYLQNLASIQPRTSPPKFAGSQGLKFMATQVTVVDSVCVAAVGTMSDPEAKPPTGPADVSVEVNNGSAAKLSNS